MKNKTYWYDSLWKVFLLNILTSISGCGKQQSQDGIFHPLCQTLFLQFHCLWKLVIYSKQRNSGVVRKRSTNNDIRLQIRISRRLLKSVLYKHHRIKFLRLRKNKDIITHVLWLVC